MKIIFLDVETTGIDDQDRICQISFHIQGEKEYYKSLFKPPLPISVEAMSINHITNERVEVELPFVGSGMYEKIREEFSDKENILVAHNAEFDTKFMARENLVPPKVICTMKVAYSLDEEGKLGKYNLQYLRYFYNINVEAKAHDAGGDVIVLEKLFEIFNKELTVEEMLDISSKPIIFKKFAFGKYKGKLFKDVAKNDKNYLEWMLKEMTLDENMRYTVNYYLSKSNE